MSVKGFSFDGGATVEKYDYTELDNKPSIPVVDGTLSVSGAAADAKATGDEITDLKAELSDLKNIATEYPITKFSAFERGQINGTGIQNIKYRVTSSEIMLFEKEATLLVADGYKLQVAFFISKTSLKKGIYWMQHSAVIPAGSLIRITIAKVTENTGESADIDEFASKVTVRFAVDAYSEKLNNMAENRTFPILQYTMFQHGDINSNNYLLDRYYRICTGEHIAHFDIDTTLVIASGFNVTVYYFVNGSYSSTSGQQYGRFTIPANSDVKLTIRRNTENSSEIADIDEFASAVSVETPLYQITKKIAQLDNVKEVKPDTILNYAKFTNGVLVKGAVNKTQMYRVCTVDQLSFDRDLVLHIDNNFYVSVHYFVDGSFSRSEDNGIIYTIPANSVFRLFISRTTNDTTEIASIDEFTSKVTVESALVEKLDDLSNTESAFNRINSLSIPTVADYGVFANGRINAGRTEVGGYKYRVSSRNIIKFKYDATIYIAANFIGQVWYFENGVYTTSTGWIQGSIAIPAGTEVKFEIRRQSEVTSEVADIDEFTAQLTVVSALTAKLTESTQYHANGDALDVKRHGYDVEQLFACPPKRQQGWPQGMAIHNGIISQFCSAPDDSMHLIDLSDGTVIATLTDTHSGHGNTAVFSDEYYDANDEFPLCYVSTGTVCNVVRIERTGVTLIRSINTDDIEHSGYQVSYTIDKATNTLWGIGYYVNNWQQRDGNHMLFSQWDLSNMTEVESGVFKPAYIGGFTMPYIGGAVQGIRFFNNRLWICQQDTAEDPQVYTNIFVMDTDKHRYVSTISEFPNPVRNYESESIEFVLNSAGDRYDMILLTTEHYYRVTFN